MKFTLLFCGNLFLMENDILKQSPEVFYKKGILKNSGGVL